ncbi:glycosyltransferase family 4 protein [Nitratifractor sp.]
MKITVVNRMMGIKFGGGENFDLNIARALKNRGHDVRFVIGTAKGIEEPVKLDEEFDVHRIDTPYLRKWHYRLSGESRCQQILGAAALELDLWMFERKAERYLRRDGWSDIFQLCGLARLGNSLAKRSEGAPRPSVVVRWPGPPSPRKISLMRHCDANIANGDAYRHIRERLYTEVRFVNIGVDTDYFRPAEKENRPFVRFLFVGRIVPVKNLPFLVRGFKAALKEEPDMQLEIVGSGEREEIHALKKLIGEECRIILAGEKKGRELVRMYQQSDVFCLVSQYDNYPNALLESMACGLPGIATRVGGIPDQVQEGKTTLLIDPDDIEALSRAILTLARGRRLREEMGKAAREMMIERFSWGRSAQVLEELYLEVRKGMTCVEL